MNWSLKVICELDENNLLHTESTNFKGTLEFMKSIGRKRLVTSKKTQVKCQGLEGREACYKIHMDIYW